MCVLSFGFVARLVGCSVEFNLVPCLFFFCFSLTCSSLCEEDSLATTANTHTKATKDKSHLGLWTPFIVRKQDCGRRVMEALRLLSYWYALLPPFSLCVCVCGVVRIATAGDAVLQPSSPLSSLLWFTFHCRLSFFFW